MPIVATDSEGPSEILHDGIDGDLVPRGDAERLAETLGAMIADPERAAQLGANAYRQARATYDLPCVARRLDLAVRCVVAGAIGAIDRGDRMSETQAIDWESRYRDRHRRLGAARPQSGVPRLARRRALAPCRILVPGSGRSLEPLALAEAGFDVTVVDAAPSAVATQRAHFARLKLCGAGRTGGSVRMGSRCAVRFRSTIRPVFARCRQGCGQLCAAAAPLAASRGNAVHPVHAERPAERTAIPLRYRRDAAAVRVARLGLA